MADRGMTMTKEDWELVGMGPLDSAGAVWRCRLQSRGWLYAMWNVETKTWSLTYVPWND